MAGAALAAHVLQVAEQAAAGLASGAGELAAAQWLDAEDAAIYQGMAWALEHDAPAALRLAVALAPWWRLRGRWIHGTTLLQRAAERAGPGASAWHAAQIWMCNLSQGTSNYDTLLAQYSAVADALAGGPASADLVDSLTGRSGALRNLGRAGRGDGGRPGRAGTGPPDRLRHRRARGADRTQPGLGLCGRRRGPPWSGPGRYQRIDQAKLPGWVARNGGGVHVVRAHRERAARGVPRPVRAGGGPGQGRG